MNADVVLLVSTGGDNPLKPLAEEAIMMLDEDLEGEDGGRDGLLDLNP